MKCDKCHSRTCVTTWIKGQHICDNCYDMSLQKKQQKFTLYYSLLIQYIYSQGYSATFGDTYAKTGHKMGSKHYKRLAGDLNLFDKDGKYLTETSDHEPFGIFWESLDPENVWGGNWGDGNHYQHTHG